MVSFGDLPGTVPMKEDEAEPEAKDSEDRINTVLDKAPGPDTKLLAQHVAQLQGQLDALAQLLPGSKQNGHAGETAPERYPRPTHYPRAPTKHQTVVMSKQAADEALDSVREEQYHRPQPSHESTSMMYWEHDRRTGVHPGMLHMHAEQHKKIRVGGDIVGDEDDPSLYDTPHFFEEDNVTEACVEVDEGPDTFVTHYSDVRRLKRTDARAEAAVFAKQQEELTKVREASRQTVLETFLYGDKDLKYIDIKQDVQKRLAEPTNRFMIHPSWTPRICWDCLFGVVILVPGCASSCRTNV
jgi:hypothetical protein